MAHYKIKKSKDGKYYWVLFGDNNKAVARSYSYFATLVGVEHNIFCNKKYAVTDVKDFKEM